MNNKVSVSSVCVFFWCVCGGERGLCVCFLFVCVFLIRDRPDLSSMAASCPRNTNFISYSISASQICYSNFA